MGVILTDKILCVKDVLMDGTDRKTFTKGKTYNTNLNQHYINSMNDNDQLHCLGTKHDNEFLHEHFKIIR